MINRSKLYLAGLIVMMFYGSANASITRYNVTDLGTLGGSESYAFGINNLGQVVGESSLQNGDRHAFLYTNRQMLDLGTLGGNRSTANAINDAGQIVGGAVRSDGVFSAFKYINGQIQDLRPFSGDSLSVGTATNNSGQIVGNYFSNTYRGFLVPGYQDIGNYFSMANDINNLGHVVGVARDLTGPNRAFVYADGIMGVYPTPGISSVANAINDSGQAVGNYEIYNGYGRSFMFSDGQFFDIGTLGGKYSYAFDINNSGQIIGGADTTEGNSHPYLYSEGTMYDLNNFTDFGSLNGELWYVKSINDKGQIVGSAFFGDQVHAVLLNPVPLPAAAWLFFTGLIGLIGTRRKNSK